MDIAKVFHIGYQRTGSTFLQQRVLFAHPAWIAHRNTAPFFFDETLYARGAAYYRAMAEGETAAPVILESHNALSGDTLVDRPEVAARIRAVQPDARIIIGVRSHHTIIPSFHFLYVKSGGTLGYPAYVEAAIAGGKFRFDRMVAAYQDAFGADRVLVLPYEDLRADAAAYVRRALRFMEVPEDLAAGLANRAMKERYPDLGVRATLGLNRLIGESPGTGLAGGLGEAHRRKLRKQLNGLISAVCRRLPEGLTPWAHIDTAAMAPAIDEAFGACNARLGELIGRDLGALGYPVAEGAGGAADGENIAGIDALAING